MPMTDDDIIRSWDDRPDDQPRVREERLAVRVADAIASHIAMLVYAAILFWVGSAAGSEGAVTASGHCPLAWGVAVLVGVVCGSVVISLVRAVLR